MRKISDLKAADLRRLGLSASYVSELLNGIKTPSLAVAVKIERELKIPARAWLDQKAA